ncbi:MAG: tRNA lysidine(34) synthetase TilS, partial [Pseudomonadota bacterium]
GGSDSVALLMLVNDWARRRGAALHILTVDHRLRPESGAEAAGVCALASELGWPSHVLTWDTPSGNAHAARMARHRLLAGACQRLGTKHLFLGHTRDDQAETFLMRARQGSGWFGLGGMDCLSPSPAWPEGEGLTLARPLLDQRRASLRRHMERRGIGWADDPSNCNSNYERVRVRRRLAACPSMRASVDRVVEQFGRLRRAELLALADALETRTRCHSDASLDLWLDGLGAERAVRLMGWLVQAVGGHARPPRRSALRAAHRALTIEAAPARTLAGAWIVRVQPGQLSFYRDPGCAGQTERTGPYFDGRFRRAREAPAIAPRNGRASAALPVNSDAGWAEMTGPRLAHLRSIWRHLPTVSQVSS